jgi:16S rRNA (cytosine1402-N4)-methyltransferase
MPKQKQKDHIPVLLDEVLASVSPVKGERYVDMTAGYGGHARAILERTEAEVTLVDRDSHAQEVLAELFHDKPAITLMHTDFLHAAQQLVEAGEKFDIILADLGVSSPHFDNASRGFSIQLDGPLDMRMDQQQNLSAADLVNTAEEAELVRILKEYGQEPKAKRIVAGIIENRPITSTGQLAAICERAWTGYSKVHPATRTFQALRIAVNDELGQLEKALPLWVKLLRPGGRLAIISFHSLEDALVKRYFQEHGGDRYDAELEILTKKPLTAQPHELVLNPRARSARLRVSKRK